MWGQSTHCQALHAWGWGQLSPPCFRSVIYSSEEALGKICQDERWLDGRLTHRGTGSPTPPHTHSHWLPLSTPSHSIKISACASLSQVKTYSHTHITCLTRLTRLTLSLLSQEFPSGISAGATGTRGSNSHARRVRCSEGGRWKHDSKAGRSPRSKVPTELEGFLHRFCTNVFLDTQFPGKSRPGPLASELSLQGRVGERM